MLTLAAGESSVVLAPEIGGSIVGWTWRDLLVLRRALPEALIQNAARGLAAYPLVPFSNRINKARFRFQGHTYQLRRNFGDEPHRIHGVGWEAVWDAVAVTARTAHLRMTHSAQGDAAQQWPFPFVADLEFDLEPKTLRALLRMRNLHPGPAPAGLGLHPFFPRTAEATLRFNADKVWTSGPDHLPLAHVPVPPKWDHTQARCVGTAVLDNLFTGWDGTARIRLAPSPISIEMTASEIFRRLVVYTPPGKPYFAVEPVSHLTDAINRLEEVHDTGLRILNPGEELAGEVRFGLVPD